MMTLRGKVIIIMNETYHIALCFYIFVILPTFCDSLSVRDCEVSSPIL